MDPYINEWLNLVLRFSHLITGIAWIGASFYFIWLDNHLETPPEHKEKQGIKGDLWAIHGGGFYEVAKYKLAPPKMPTTLHWFKWEAYTTWISGMLLMSLMYYVGADSYLIDSEVAELSQWQAIGIGLAAIAGGWIGYEVLCATALKDKGILFGLVLLVLATALAYGLNQVFSARGAYMHMGVIIGTIMVGNVFRGIIPAQKALVNAVEAGKALDEKYGLNAKLRSTHNTYITLPLLFIMISNHYPVTFGHEFNWLILIAIILITAAVRQYFVLRHFNKNQPLILISAVAAFIGLAYMIAPEPNDSAQANTPVTVNIDRVEQIIVQRCASCHSSWPTDDIFTTAQAGVTFDNIQQMSQWAPRIEARVIQSKDMPFINKTMMTEEEREYLALWIEQGAKTE